MRVRAGGGGGGCGPPCCLERAGAGVAARQAAARRRRRRVVGAAVPIYVHDPGPRFNTKPMADTRERWGDLDHNWHVAYWLHRGLLGYAARAESVEDADVVFVAHYFLTHNPKERPLDFGNPLLGWDQVLRTGGAVQLLHNDSALIDRWRRRLHDFVVAPSSRHATARGLSMRRAG